MTTDRKARSAGPKDRDVAPYQKIAAVISERIANGVYAPGSRLPAEAQFSTEFGVTFMTLRKALAVLADQGLVYAQKGRGTFVRAISLADTVFRLEQFDSGWPDGSAEIKLLGVSTAMATAEVAERLGIAPGDRVVLLRRLILKEDIPAMYNVEYVVFNARQPLVESQLQLTTIQGVLQATRGSGFPRGNVRLAAVCLDEETAATLRVPPGSPALRLEHVFQDAGRAPVSWGRFFMRADLFQLTATLGPD
jgi:GntR family transcriptional regulator